MTPPRWARALVAFMTPTADRSWVLGDLEERFAAIGAERGWSAARRWYWLQAIRSVPARIVPDIELVDRRSWQGAGGDLRQGVRLLLRRPLYSAGVVGTLAIGLASAGIVFTVAWTVWLSPMPFPDPDRVVRLLELEPEEDATGGERTRWRLSPPLLDDLRSIDWTTVEHVGGVSVNVRDWVGEEETTRINSLVISPEVLSILGISPLAGRAFSNDEDALEVVLTEAFWQSAFGADPTVFDSESMRLGDDVYRIVGVVRMPIGYPRDTDVLTRMTFDSADLIEGMRGARHLDVIARVGPAHSVAEASAEMNRIVADLGTQYPNHAGWGGVAVSLSDELIRPYRGVLGLLGAAGGVFLLLAVVNVAGLVAARSVEGREDRAVRMALGASERRLLRASTLQSSLLAGIAAGVALLLANALLGPIRAIVPPEIPRVENIRLGLTVAMAIVGASLLAGWIVGLLGYVLARGSRSSPSRASRTVASGSKGRGAIVASQVALTTLLAIAGAGILKHIADLRTVDLGFEPEGIASAQVLLTGPRYPTPEARLVVWRALEDELRDRGLEVAVVTNAPMAGANMPWGYRPDPTAEQAFAQYHTVSADYFDLMGIELVEGRAFDENDREGTEPVIIVNEMLAAANFPNESAVGRAIQVLATNRTIVGVARSTRHAGPSEDVQEEIYAPIAQDPWPHAQLIVRGEAAAIGGAVAQAADQIDPLLGLPPMEPYDRFVSGWYAALRLQLLIVGVLAAVGTTLAMLGLYALVAYRVQMRSREIGIRMALGASDAHMVSDVVRQGGMLAVLGLALGFVAWYAAVPFSGDLLGDVRVSGMRVPLSVGAGVFLVSLLASAIPARRSTRVDPAVTLRAE